MSRKLEMSEEAWMILLCVCIGSLSDFPSWWPDLVTQHTLNNLGLR